MLRVLTAIFFCSLVYVSVLFAGDYPDWYYKSDGGPGFFGPYACVNGSCLIRVPNPDDGTLACIRSIDASLVTQLDRARKIGDNFKICNESYCAIYTRTSSMHEFDGGFVEPVVIPGSGSTGSGGGGGQETGSNGGGYNPGAGGGGGGGGTGKVIVNEPVVVEN